MKIFITALRCLLLSIFFGGFVEAKGWCGIVPFKSTRSDVMHILGRTTQADEIRAKYKLEEGDITTRKNL